MWSESTHNGKRCILWGDEVSATNPGKHGSEDWLVKWHVKDWSDGTRKPTHQAQLFSLGFMALAQRSWPDDGDDLKWLGIEQWVDSVLKAGSPEAIKSTVQESLAMWERRRAGQRPV